MEHKYTFEWTTGSAPETEEWREDLSPEESALVEQWDEKRAAAAASGQSLQGYCLHAIEYYMEHIDNKTEEQNA